MDSLQLSFSVRMLKSSGASRKCDFLQMGPGGPRRSFAGGTRRGIFSQLLRNVRQKIRTKFPSDMILDELPRSGSEHSEDFFFRPIKFDVRPSGETMCSSLFNARKTAEMWSIKKYKQRPNHKNTRSDLRENVFITSRMSYASCIRENERAGGEKKEKKRRGLPEQPAALRHHLLCV